jgi:urea transport system substrate-binding protein
LKDNALLFYPSQYEGEKTSRNIFYTGATPPQQAIPAVNFLRAQGINRFFLVGTDYIYPRTTNAVLKGYLASQGITRCPERCAALGQSDWREVVEDIRRFAKGGNGGSKIAVIATVSGDANVHFFRESANRDVTAAEIPVMSRRSPKLSCRLCCPPTSLDISWRGIICTPSIRRRTAPSSPTGGAPPAGQMP